MAKKRISKRSRSRSSGTSSKGNLMISAISAVGYGLMRQSIAEKIPPFMGEYTDEAMIGGAAAIATIFGGPKVKAAAMPIAFNELARVTEKLKNQYSSPSNAGSSGLVYY